MRQPVSPSNSLPRDASALCARRTLALGVLAMALGACGDNAKTPASPSADGAPAAPDSGALSPFPNLHVPSPAWQDQIIYFVMTDRFADGDPANNDQGGGEYDPADERKYSGGDLQGVVDKLDYIQGLGATAVWITPPVANLWWDPLAGGSGFGGYHGYWAENFKAVDAHLGTLDTYKGLSNALHERGMYLIQDIVANHTGNFFTYVDPSGANRYDPANPTANLIFNTAATPVAKPSQPPFDGNDPAAFESLDQAIYHYTPNVQDYNNEQQVLYWQLADLDDLNTENPEVRRALRDSYGHWIREVGVDGFRVDTAIYVEHAFWNDFIHSTDESTPGINAVAAATGRDSFLTAGEAFISSEPLDDAGDRRAASYLGTEEAPELASVIGFPMHFTLNEVFAEGKPTRHLGYRLQVGQDTSIYRNPYLVPHFVDNHDVARFLSRGSRAALEQALMYIMTIPGIPVIYYGTEQGFTEPRAAMFAGGVGSGGQDHFDTGSELYQYIKTLAELRTADRTFTRGTVSVLAEDTVGPGVFAYKREHEGKTAVIVFNSADRPVLLGNLDTGLPAGTRLSLLAGRLQEEDLVVDARGFVTRELPAREAMVLLANGKVEDVADPGVTIAVATKLDGVVMQSDLTIAGSVTYAGSAPPRLLLVVDGNIGEALEIAVQPDGAWSIVLPLGYFAPGESLHTVAVYAPDAAVASPRYQLAVNASVVGDLRGSASDPAGDDTGPSGYSYTLPTDASFGGQMDLRDVTAVASDTFLQIDVTTAEITDVWGPNNGFDHVLFHIYIDVPGRDGVSVLPRINATAPKGFAWDYMVFIEGWTNRLYSSAGATAESYGQNVTPVASVAAIDRAAGKIRFVLAAESLGSPKTLEGARIYVTTWDWNGLDGQYRPLTQTGGPFVFGGGNGAVDPLIIDASAVITLSPK